jgi:acyl-coenzyme A thioesterase PaaI-like protein
MPDRSAPTILESAANRCFVCGTGNPIGLGVRFRVDGDLCRGEFTPDERHMGYEGVTHGGILFALLDDVMANWLWLRGQRCFTARADVRYRAPLPVRISVELTSSLVRRKGRLVQLAGRVQRSDTGEVVAEANGTFMTD